jgi:hypothetical protein
MLAGKKGSFKHSGSETNGNEHLLMQKGSFN